LNSAQWLFDLSWGAGKKVEKVETVGGRETTEREKICRIL
jgi:hypothetical protein